MLWFHFRLLQRSATFSGERFSFLLFSETPEKEAGELGTGEAPGLDVDVWGFLDWPPQDPKGHSQRPNVLWGNTVVICLSEGQPCGLGDQVGSRSDTLNFLGHYF